MRDDAKINAAHPHYKVVSISLYTEDIELLSSLVEQAKANGHTRANKSEVIRKALSLVVTDNIYPPKRGTRRHHGR